MENLEQTVEKSFLRKVKNNLRRVRDSVAGRVAVYSLIGVLSGGFGLGYGCSQLFQEPESWPVGETEYDHYISSPLIADLTNKGKQQVIVDVWHGNWNGEWKKRIYVLNEHGNNLGGWLKDSQYTRPNRDYGTPFGSYRIGVGDLEGDGTKEVIYWDKDEADSGLEQISAVHYDGSPVAGWPIYGERLPAFLMAEDLNNDKKAEVLGIYDKGNPELWLFQNEGKVVAGWPRDLPSDSHSFWLGDIDKKEGLEIVFGGSYLIQAWKAWKDDESDVAGYPLDYNELGTALCTSKGSQCRFIPPMFLSDADKDGNLDIIVQTHLSSGREDEKNEEERGMLIIDSITREIKYEWGIPCQILGEKSSPRAFVLREIGDIDQDGDLELVLDNYCYKEGTIAVYHHDGKLLTELVMSKTDVSNSSGTALVADLDKAPGLEIVTLLRNNYDEDIEAGLQIYSGLTGKLLGNVEFGFMENVEFMRPAVGDLDGDGNPDLVESGYVHYVGGKVNKWEFNQ